MKAYVINLADRHDRMAFMQSQLEVQNIDFCRIDAVRPDNKQGFDSLYNSLTKQGLSRYEACCALSHYKIWVSFLESDDEYRLILEDDIHLAEDTAEVLHALSFKGWKEGVLKLDTLNATVTAARSVEFECNQRSISEIFTTHSGTAAYVLSRSTAELLVAAFANFRYAVDIEVFDTERRQLNMIRVFQLSPACCIQDTLLPGSTLFSSIHERQDSEGGLRRVLNSKIVTSIKPIYRLLYSVLLLPLGKKRTLVRFRG